MRCRAVAIAMLTVACAPDTGSTSRTIRVINASAAMEPTIRANDSVAVTLFDASAQAYSLERGALVVYALPADTAKQFIKRLVGLPGDTLAMVRGRLHLNGQPLEEPYTRRSEADTALAAVRNNWGPLVVPPDSFFVLGDNREQSADSRYWGFVPARLILGRVHK